MNLVRQTEPEDIQALHHTSGFAVRMTMRFTACVEVTKLVYFTWWLGCMVRI